MGFQERRRLSKNEINLRLGNGTLVSASAVGDIRVCLDSKRQCNPRLNLCSITKSGLL